MANFTLTWDVQPGAYQQDLFLKPKYSGSFNLIATFDGEVESFQLNGLADNTIYQYKLRSFCDSGLPKETAVFEIIGITCPVVTLTPLCNGVINYSFPHLGGDIDEYEVVLYTNADVEITRQTKSVSSTVSGSFTGLAAYTTYKVRVVAKADAFIRSNCSLVPITTLGVTPQVVSSPQSVARCDDGPQSVTTLNASFFGGNLVYTWHRNGVLITDGGNYSGATTSSLTIQNAGSILGSFTCTATNECGFATTQPAVITLIGDTQLNVQPSIIPTCVVDPITLSVSASGESVTFQWQVSTDGGNTFSNIPGATASSYIIPGGTAVEGHRYRCVINSFCGPEVITTSATVDTVAAPVITSQPSSVQSCSGSTVNLTVGYTAEYATAANWQVFTGGTWVDIPGATGTTYSTTSAGSYRFRVTNACGEAVSNTAVVTSYSNVSFTSVNSGATLCVGQNATFTNIVAGDVVSMQWYVSTDGGSTYNIISGATSNAYTVSNVQYFQNDYKYKLVVTGQCNTIENVSTLVVRQGVTSVNPPSDQAVCDGSSYTFSAVVTSDSPVTYTWQESANGVNYTTVGSSSSYSSTATLAKNGYYYRVTVSSCGINNIYTARLYVNSGVNITSQPVSVTTCENSSATFVVAATGSGASYQWQEFSGGSWSSIGGATNTSYTLSNLPLSSSGRQFRVIVNGACGSVTSNTVTLTVNSSAPNWVNGSQFCSGCDLYVTQTDTNPCSSTYNQTQNVLVQSNSTSCGGCCGQSTSPTWTVTGTICIGCDKYNQETDTNPCSLTHNTTRQGSLIQSNSPDCSGCCGQSTAPNWVNTGAYTCSGCDKYNIERDNNPCSPTFNNTRTGSLVESNSTFCGGCCGQSTSPVWTDEGAPYCESCVSKQLQRDTNACSATYNTTRVINAGSACNTSATWVNRDINEFYVCVGFDKHYQQIDTNPCSPTYNQTQTGSLYQANSVDCGFTACNCPPGYTVKPDNSGCYIVESVPVNGSPNPGTPKTLLPYQYHSYGNYGIVVYTGGFNIQGAATGTPTINNTNPFWFNPSGGAFTFQGPLNRCGLWTQTMLENQAIGFSVCINVPTTKTYLIGMGVDNYGGIRINGTTIVTQNPVAMGNALSVGIDVTFKYWNVYPVTLQAGENVIEVTGVNTDLVAVLGIEIYDCSVSTLINATSYGDLGSALLFSTKDYFNQVIPIYGTGGVGYTCPFGYSLKTCNLATPTCVRVTYTSCGCPEPTGVFAYMYEENPN